MTKKKQGPRAIRENYKGALLTIDEFIMLPECQLGRVSVALKLRSGMTFTEIINAGNQTMRKRVQHPYRDGTISVDDFSKLKLCTIPKNSVHTKIRKGQTMDEIAAEIADLKQPKRRGKNKPKPTFAKVKEQPKPKKVKLVDVERERIKKIMAVPQNPITTQVHYMPKTVMGAGEQTATRLSDNGWQGRP